MSDVLFIDSDNNIRVEGLQSTVNGVEAYENAATVQVTLLDSLGAEVAGESWPKALLYETGSDGNYSTVLSDTLTLTSGASYVAEITTDAGVDKHGKREVKIRAVKHR